MAAVWRPYVETCIELFGAEPLHVREQLPGRQDGRSATPRCGTPSSASSPAPRATKSWHCSPAPRRASTGWEIWHDPRDAQPLALGRRRPDRRRQSLDRRAPARGIALGAERPGLRSEPRDRRQRAVSCCRTRRRSCCRSGPRGRIRSSAVARWVRPTTPARMSNGSR